MIDALLILSYLAGALYTEHVYYKLDGGNIAEALVMAFVWPMFLPLMLVERRKMKRCNIVENSDSIMENGEEITNGK